MSNLEVFSENEHQADEPSQHWKQERAASGSRRREGYVNRVEHEDDREKSEEQTQVREERRVLQIRILRTAHRSTRQEAAHHASKSSTFVARLESFART